MTYNKFEKPRNLDEYLDKGGEVSNDKLPDNNMNWTNFTLRIRKDLSREIDISLENRIGISKTAWILEAIQEKLRK